MVKSAQPFLITDPQSGETIALREWVKQHLQQYLQKQQPDHDPRDLHTLLVTEMEIALFEVLLRYCRGNQSRIADILGINRTTLRSKLKKYPLY